jgi:hypothetical protein
MCRKFSAVQEHCPPEKLLATRHSLFAAVSRLADLPISRLADNLARQEPRPPNSSVFGWAGAQPSKLLFAIRYSLLAVTPFPTLQTAFGWLILMQAKMAKGGMRPCRLSRFR